MQEDIKRAGINCLECGYELLISEDKVFCQNCTEGNKFRRIRPL